MRADPLIRSVRPGDAEQLAPLLRREDAAECLTLGLDPLGALVGSVAISGTAFAVELGGELAAMGGVAPGPRLSFLGPAAYDIPWLLTGPAVARYPRAFWRASVAVMAELRRRHPVLLNLVDARYLAALRWVARLGAEVQPAIPCGVAGLPFHPVIWRS